MPEAVREYRLKPEGFAEARRRTIFFWVSLMIFIMAALVTLFPTPLSFKALKRDPSLPVSISAVLLICGHELKKNLQEKQRRWIGYIFEINDVGCVSRRCEGLPTISIAPNEITRILEAPGNGANVIAGEVRFLSIPLTLRSIPVPNSLAGYDEFLDRLRQLKPTDVQAPSLLLRVFSVAAAPLLFLCVYSAFAFPDHRLNLVGSIFLLGIVVCAILASHRISKRTGESKLSPKVLFSIAVIILNGAFHLYKFLAV